MDAIFGNLMRNLIAYEVMAAISARVILRQNICWNKHIFIFYHQHFSIDARFNLNLQEINKTALAVFFCLQNSLWKYASRFAITLSMAIHAGVCAQRHRLLWSFIVRRQLLPFLKPNQGIIDWTGTGTFVTEPKLKSTPVSYNKKSPLVFFHMSVMANLLLFGCFAGAQLINGWYFLP